VSRLAVLTEGRVAVITGAAIGLAAAARFAGGVAKHGSSHVPAVPTDVSEPDAMHRLRDTVRGIRTTRTGSPNICPLCRPL
jgi:hypothetical protein